MGISMPECVDLLGPAGKDIVQILVAVGTLASAVVAAYAAFSATQTAKLAITPRADFSVFFTQDSHGNQLVSFLVVNQNPPPIWCGILLLKIPFSDDIEVRCKLTLPPYNNKKIEFGEPFAFSLPVEHLIEDKNVIAAYKKAVDGTRSHKCEFQFDFIGRLKPKAPFPPKLHAFLKDAIAGDQ